jgi:membrane glycosyltransferase
MTDVAVSTLARIATGEASLAVRRALFATLTVTTICAMITLAALALRPGGIGVLDIALLALFAVTLPWIVIGFWNAVIGFIIMRFATDPVAAVFPASARVTGSEPITSSTAVLVCIRNEPPERVARNLEPMLAELAACGAAEHFHIYVLSDTTDAILVAAEEARFAALTKTWRERVAVTYRRRTANTGFKAGNIQEFCARFGAAHDLAVTLDADSVMPASAMLRLVRVMQADPKLGIVQGLVVGLPSMSAMARIFQFGMRLGMRSYTIGGAWWQGDCGPYWGHNAVLRLRPFAAHCELPLLAGDRHILSHDQIEAVLMRRAGYEVRVLPEENLGWEENPPTLVEFIRRDLRWCAGNMQYWPFLLMPGLQTVSRYQLLLAILMFLGSPAWIGLLLLGTLAIVLDPAAIDPRYGWPLFAAVLVMWFAAKIASIIDVLARDDARRAFGGSARFLASAAIETLFFILLVPIQWGSHTIMLANLALGRAIGWSAQVRHEHAVALRDAIAHFWPHALIGWGAIVVLAWANPAALPVALLIAGGLALAVPMAVVTAAPGVGRVLAGLGIGRLPEETNPPPILAGLMPAAQSLPVLDGLRSARGVLRSLRIYYGDRLRHAAMDRLHAGFVRPGDVVFDIGAHVGDRVGSFRRLGARVVAVEPQPALIATLRLIHGRDRAVAIEAAAVGRHIGTIPLRLNLDNPTISTASDDLVQAAAGAPGWANERWTTSVVAPMTTLDTLVARHGTPAFIKIDVEGFEAEALAGLSRPVAALSFEFTTIQRDVAIAALRRCASLGFRHFNAALGESQTFVHERWIDATVMEQWLLALPLAANSGDVYARLATNAAESG